MIRAKRIIAARKRPDISQVRPASFVSVHQSVVVRWEFGQFEPHDLFVRTIEAITDADIVRSPEAA